MLDNFLVNESLLDYISDAGVMHLGDNLSRNSPILLKLRFGDIPVKQPSVSLPQPRRPLWYKATDENKAEYTELLKERLDNLACPESLFCDNVHCTDHAHRQERDSHFIELLTSMIESSHRAIPLSKPRNITRSDGVRKNIPGW